MSASFLITKSCKVPHHTVFFPLFFRHQKRRTPSPALQGPQGAALFRLNRQLPIQRLGHALAAPRIDRLVALWQCCWGRGGGEGGRARGGGGGEGGEGGEEGHPIKAMSRCWDCLCRYSISVYTHRSCRYVHPTCPEPIARYALD